MPAPARLSRRLAGLPLLCLMLVLMLMAGLAIGARPLALADVWTALLHPDGNRTSLIVWKLRLPRTATGAVAGMALGIAGALTQALARNPLAEPGLLGINAGAALAVVIGIGLKASNGFTGAAAWAISGAILAALCVQALSRAGPAAQRGVHLVLTAAAVSATIRALTGIITLSDSAVFDGYRFWAVGALNHTPPQGLPVILGGLLALCALTLSWGASLNALALGTELTQSLGLKIGRLRGAIFGAVVLLCGLSTALVGPIAFLGLIAPHLARLLVGPDWRWLLPYAAMVGAGVLVGADILGRIVAPPGELEAGIVTAFLGAPVLLFLLGRRP